MDRDIRKAVSPKRVLSASAVASSLLAVQLTLAVCGCAHEPVASTPATAPATLSGDSAHPGQTQGWVDVKLYFGLGLADHPENGVSEAQWRDFLDKEVTPRFPSGLSVVDVYGQWQGKNQTAPERLSPMSPPICSAKAAPSSATSSSSA